MSTTRRVLIAGLNVHADIPEYYRTIYGTPEEIQAKIDADTKLIRQAGVDCTEYQIDDADPETGLRWLEAKIQNETFDGILIGAGLRLVPTQTALYEAVVNLCRKVAPASTVFMFNAGPGTNYQTLERNWGSFAGNSV